MMVVGDGRGREMEDGSEGGEHWDRGENKRERDER